jgi:hypothetical protein
MKVSRQAMRATFARHLRRLLSAPDGLHDRPRASRGHLVELIGPTGVGKTHLYAHLLPEIGDQWLSRRQVRPLMKDCDPFAELDGALATLVEDLLAWKHQNIWALDIPLWRKVALLQYVTREMALDIYARASVIPLAGMFADTGLTHNFAAELLRWHEQCADPSGTEALRAFLRGRSIILLDADADTILKNLKRRNVAGQEKRNNALLAYWTEAQVLEKSRHDRDTARAWLALAASLGVPTLVVDLGQGLDAGKEKVLRFLGDIQCAGGSSDAPPKRNGLHS